MGAVPAAWEAPGAGVVRVVEVVEPAVWVAVAAAVEAAAGEVEVGAEPL